MTNGTATYEGLVHTDYRAFEAIFTALYRPNTLVDLREKYGDDGYLIIHKALDFLQKHIDPKTKIVRRADLSGNPPHEIVFRNGSSVLYK